MTQTDQSVSLPDPSAAPTAPGARGSGWVGDADAGVDVHAVLDGIRVNGPTFGNPFPALPLPLWHIAGHADILHLLRTPGLVDGRLWAALAAPFGDITLTLDGDAHRTRRALVAPHEWADQTSRWIERVVNPITLEMVRALPGHAVDGSVDLMTALCVDLPLRVMSRLLGIPADEFAWVRDAAMRMLRFQSDRPVAEAAMTELGGYFGELVAERRGGNDDDLITIMTRARARDGAQLSDAEIVTSTRQLLGAGTETTMRALGSMLVGLLDSGQWGHVVAAPHLADAAAREALRWEAALAGVPRMVAVDLRLTDDGPTIPAGSPMMLWLTGANRDPRRWARPAWFDMHRARLVNVAFGSGPHVCVGAELGRAEMIAVLQALAQVWPRMAMEATPPIVGLMLRSPAEVRVTLAPPRAVR